MRRSPLLHRVFVVGLWGKAIGLVKLGVVAGVLRRHRWAYPVAISVLGAFIAYQIYRLSYAFSLGLLLLTLFDAAIVGLTWREYTQTSGEER
ncbi:MAG: DUF2127 domain-containing protein [Chloroflexales bacterium]